MLLAQKKKLTYVTIGTYFFLGGVEYAVILPTIWLYLSNEFNSTYTMMGLVITAFQLPALLFSPLIGWISDVTGQTKLLLLFCNLWEMGGAVMYFAASSAWFLVASRFVSGVGTCVGGALFADITRVTTVEERTGVFSMFMACRMFGLVVGPAFNLFLRKFDFFIGPYHINKYTAPGLFMACIWTLHELQCLFIYWNLRQFRNLGARNITESQINYNTDLPSDAHSVDNGTLHQENEDSKSEDEPDVSEVNPYPHFNADPTAPSTHSSLLRRPQHFQPISAEHTYSSSTEMIESAERYMSPVTEIYNEQYAQSSDSNPRDSLGYHGGDISAYDTSVDTTINRRSPVTSSCQQPVKLWSWQFYYQEYIREEIIVVLATAFLSWFNQMCLETILTPLSNRLLGWGELENSIFYFVAGATVILGFVAIRILSRYVEDRKLLLFGVILLTTETVILIIFSPHATPDDQHNLGWLLTCASLGLIALPFVFVTFPSLFSKLTIEESQGFSQGLRRVINSLAGILGPLWAGSLLATPTQQYVMFSVMAGLQVLVLVMLMLSFKRLKVSDSNTSPVVLESSNRLHDSDSMNERSPLLRSA